MCKNKLCNQCQNKLLDLANNSIINFLTTGRKLTVNPKNLPEIFTKPRGNFVTIEVNNSLHGCIGKIETEDPLYLDIIDNAVEAGFYDTRFEPLTKEDLAGLKVEISLLTKPEILPLKKEKEIKDYLTKNKPGVILQSGFYRATFLPQVWEDLSGVDDFLSQLSYKAGMDQDGWKTSKIFTYQAEIIK